MHNILNIDDKIDVFAVHGVGGIFGTVMIAVFGAGSRMSQLGALIIVGIFTIVVTTVLIKVFGRSRSFALTRTLRLQD